MNYQQIIDKYYEPESPLWNILMTHSRRVADKALSVARTMPELNIDESFVEEAAMLHDIGVFLTNAPGIQCFGTEPYICHGLLGAELMRREGYPRHALVCERHTGTGLTCEQIIRQNLPLPHRNFVPVSIEEQLICWADKFFSKTRPEQEKTPEQARRSLEKFGAKGLVKFDEWCHRFR